MSSSELTTAACWAGRPVARKIIDTVPRGRVVITGVVCVTRVTEERGTDSFECLMDDGSGELGLLFLGRRTVPGITIGTRCTVEGTARIEGGRFVLWNPLYQIEPANE